jgi:hypothetical protein
MTYAIGKGYWDKDDDGNTDMFWTYSSYYIRGDRASIGSPPSYLYYGYYYYRTQDLNDDGVMDNWYLYRYWWYMMDNNQDGVPEFQGSGTFTWQG